MNLFFKFHQIHLWECLNESNLSRLHMALEMHLAQTRCCDATHPFLLVADRWAFPLISWPSSKSLSSRLMRERVQLQQLRTGQPVRFFFVERASFE